MSISRWSSPVTILSTEGGRQTVRGPFEALIFLLDEWPDKRGPAYVRARSACRAALAGRQGPDWARDMFLQAAQEAQIVQRQKDEALSSGPSFRGGRKNLSSKEGSRISDRANYNHPG
ncbi:DUF982 domain-containing protein [Agrobacterium tumefaciens]|uniref:DUF982 domain-containing protein n=1 Tax=Agrobacterium tumefaciens TaxID=358 RepID=UPI0015727E1D|nr:DUF982 domain-containing protein [Agrobacterium tumefaciens]